MPLTAAAQLPLMRPHTVASLGRPSTRAAGTRFGRALAPTIECRKVAVLGAAGGIGQPLSLLLKMQPLVTHLALYDVAPLVTGVGADLSHCNTNTKVGREGRGSRGMCHAGLTRRRGWGLRSASLPTHELQHSSLLAGCRVTLGAPHCARW